jgi:hypothetical protein
MTHLVCVGYDGTECRHQSDTEDERDRVDPLIAVLVGMELGDEIRGGNIDEHARRCGQNQPRCARTRLFSPKHARTPTSAARPERKFTINAVRGESLLRIRIA